ncbi:MAG: PRC-barrel domain-containing protein [Methanobrevibacter sp.]|jgi:sporulation protein YlmC with PRC-barrel domain|nr:PRC-barrel domain-containing protein [Candidatus Methanoflexus mossambicus]
MEGKFVNTSEEKVWSEMKGYTVITNNARFLGDLEELIIDESAGRIVDIAIKIPENRKVRVSQSRQKGNLLFVPFKRVEKVGEFIMVTE